MELIEQTQLLLIGLDTSDTRHKCNARLAIGILNPQKLSNESDDSRLNRLLSAQDGQPSLLQNYE